MELEFIMEFVIGFNGKVLDEGNIEVVVEGKVRNIKRTIGERNQPQELICFLVPYKS